MRKICLFVAIISLMSFGASAQSKLGLKFSPSISSTRVSLIDDQYDVTSGKPAFKFGIGLIYDHEITKTYFFSTGLILVPKQIGFEVAAEPDQPFAVAPAEPNQSYQLNYLQIPLSLKLFTNEVQPDTKIFFQVGLAPEFKISDDPTKEEYKIVQTFGGTDISVMFGAGAEYRAGVNTSLFGALTLQRGLSNALKVETFGFQDKLYLRSSLINLDLGIKF